MDAYHDIDWRRICRYVYGEYTPEEEAELREWIAEDQARAALANELRQVWKATEGSAKERDVDAAWEAVQGQLASEATAEGKTSDRPGQGGYSTTRRLRRTGRSWSRVVVGAVVIAAIAFIVGSLRHMAPGHAPSSQAKVFTTEKGQRAKLHLADGTKVHLNADSKLTLSPNFASTKREVVLEGEAYFDVARDTVQPFIVQAGEASVRVLGTSFNVAAYADDERVEVAVTEGEVALKADRSERQDAVVLKPRQLGVASGQHLQAVQGEVDLTRYIAWTKGKLVFRDARFGEVRRKLSRWYDLRIEMQVPSGSVDRLNATFDNAPLSQILKAVGAALGLEYTYDRSEGVVSFYRPGDGRRGAS